MENIIIISFAAVILFGLVYQTVTYFIFRNEIRKHNKNKLKEISSFPSISILKPIKGIDDQLESNLESFFKLDYPDYEIIFGLHSNEDPALEIIQNLIKNFPQIKTQVVIDDFKIGLNPKINNLYNMYPKSKGQFIFISDSNTRVESDFLKQMMNEFEDKNTGLTTATIRGLGAKNIPSLLENIHLNSFLSPSVFSASHLAKISIVIGKAILIPRYILEQIGGFEAFKFYLAEDYLMGIKVEDLGYKVKTSSVFVNNINEKLTFKKFLNRHSRWAKMRAKIRLNTYLLESFSNPISASFILAAIMHNTVGLEQFVIVSVVKSLIDLFSLRLIKSDIKFYQIIFVPLKDLIIGLLWYVPFFNSEVTWRNNTFKIRKDSLLQPLFTD